MHLEAIHQPFVINQDLHEALVIQVVGYAFSSVATPKSSRFALKAKEGSYEDLGFCDQIIQLFKRDLK